MTRKTLAEHISPNGTSRAAVRITKICGAILAVASVLAMMKAVVAKELDARVTVPLKAQITAVSLRDSSALADIAATQREIQSVQGATRYMVVSVSEVLLYQVGDPRRDQIIQRIQKIDHAYPAPPFKDP